MDCHLVDLSISTVPERGSSLPTWATKRQGFLASTCENTWLDTQISIYTSRASGSNSNDDNTAMGPVLPTPSSMV